MPVNDERELGLYEAESVGSHRDLFGMSSPLSSDGQSSSTLVVWLARHHIETDPGRVSRTSSVAGVVLQIGSTNAQGRHHTSPSARSFYGAQQSQAL